MGRRTDRRNFIVQGIKMAAGAQLGLSCLNALARLFPHSERLWLAQRALAIGDVGGMAYALDGQPTYAMVHIVLIDKVQAALFEQIPGGVPQGADGLDGAAQKASPFRGMGLNKLFGDSVAGLSDQVGLVLNNAWASGNGGHSLQNSVVSAALGGVNNAFEKLSGGTGLLGPVGFSLRSSAQDSSDAFLAGGAKRMQTFSNVGQLATTLKNSVNPLLAGPDAKNMMKEFDALVTKDTSFRDALSDLATKIQVAIPELDKAGGETYVVAQQTRAIIALHKSGACRNFMLAVPWDDTNANGDLTTGGGSQNLSPFVATPMIGKAIVYLHAAIPNLIIVSTSDGGRGLDNSDQSDGFAFMSGPSGIIKNGIVGPKFTDTKQLGAPVGDVASSSGQNIVSAPKNWYATALKAVGLDAGVDHIPGALQG